MVFDRVDTLESGINWWTLGVPGRASWPAFNRHRDSLSPPLRQSHQRRGRSRRGLSFHRLFCFSSSSTTGTTRECTRTHDYIRTFAPRRGVYYRLSPFDDRYVIPARRKFLINPLTRMHLFANNEAPPWECKIGRFRISSPALKRSPTYIHISSIRARFSRGISRARKIERTLRSPLWFIEAIAKALEKFKAEQRVRDICSYVYKCRKKY